MYFILRADALGSRRGVESSLLQCWIHKRVFMVCERISVCLGRKLFDLQKSQKTSRISLKINQRTFHSPIKMLLELILMMSDFTSALSADQQGFSGLDKHVVERMPWHGMCFHPQECTREGGTGGTARE
ncbi:uncharacterized protein [Equus przewalskii]|uniref:Uncharacterized protein isoform X4 n=1 Tax=Equus przewalskii TaxID=9798 RepID=A0ABM4MLT4_EQUPR